MIRDFLHSLPPGVLIAAFALGFALCCIVAIAALRVIGRRFGTSAATIQVPAWLILGLTGGLVGVTLLFWEEPVLLLPGYLGVALPLTMGYSRYRRRNAPFRAIRRMNAGDHAGAVAELRARINRQRRALGLAEVGQGEENREGQEASRDPSAVPASLAPSDEFNPYAAPVASTASAGDRLGLANDLNNLGVVESNRGDWAAALIAYDEAAAVVEAGPVVPVIRGNRGYALIELGRADEGLPLLREAIDDLAPSDRWVRAQFLTALADKLLGLGQTAEVGDLLARARREGRRETVYPRAGKRAWLTRLDNLRDRLAATRGDPAGATAG